MQDTIIAPVPSRKSWHETVLGAEASRMHGPAFARRSEDSAAVADSGMLTCALHRALAQNAAAARRRNITITASAATHTLLPEQRTDATRQISLLLARTLPVANRGSSITCRVAAKNNEIHVHLTFAPSTRRNAAYDLIDERWSWNFIEQSTPIG
jgi:hypothetical protein